MNVRILHSGSKAQGMGDSRSHRLQDPNVYVVICALTSLIHDSCSRLASSLRSDIEDCSRSKYWCPTSYGRALQDAQQQLSNISISLDSRGPRFPTLRYRV